jgi:hypothetical protein
VIDDRSRIVHADGFDLPFRVEQDGTPWAECEAVGAWLGYARARDARKLALRLRADGIINESELRATVAQSSGGRPAQEVWLTRKGALKLAARSDTPRSAEKLDLIVTVFEAALDGRIKRSPAFDMDTLAEAVAAKLRPSLRATETAALPAVLLDPRFRAATIKHKVRECVAAMARIDHAHSPRSHTTAVHNWLHGVAGYGGSGRAWGSAPLDVYLSAVGSLDGMLGVLRRLDRIPPDMRQVPLRSVG